MYLKPKSHNPSFIALSAALSALHSASILSAGSRNTPWNLYLCSSDHFTSSCRYRNSTSFSQACGYLLPSEGMVVASADVHSVVTDYRTRGTMDGFACVIS